MRHARVRVFEHDTADAWRRRVERCDSVFLVVFMVGAFLPIRVNGNALLIHITILFLFFFFLYYLKFLLTRI